MMGIAGDPMTHTYTVVLRREPEGCYTVIVPALPGCLTEGDDVPEALAAAREAIECYLESLVIDEEPIPDDPQTLSFDRNNLTEGFLFRVTAEVPEGVAAHA